MQFNNSLLNDQFNCILEEISFYTKVREDYEALQKDLEENEHLRHVYEPSARLLLERAEEDLTIAVKQLSNSMDRDVNSLPIVANLLKVSTMDITLQTPENVTSGFIDLRLLGKTLSSFQSLIYSIISPSKGRKKKEVTDAAALLVSAFAPGSFVVRIHEQTNGLIADENLILETTVPVIVDLMEASEDVNRLKEISSQVDLMAVSAYRNLLKTLSGGESGISVQWVSPSGNNRDYSMNYKQIQNALSTFNSDRSLTSRTITVDGILTMLEKDDTTKRRRFKMTSFDGTPFTGIVDENLTGHFVPTNITALIEEKIELNKTTDEEYVTYILLAIGDYSKD